MFILAVATLVSTACAGQTPALRKQNDKLAADLAELRADARRERVRVQDLEKQLALSQAKAQQGQSPGQPRPGTAAAERPKLPVEVRSPESLGSERELPEQYEIMGMDDEGVEIIYVGEAASEKVLKIPPRYFDDRGGDSDYDDEPARPSLRTVAGARGQGPVPTATDRLPVTRSVPTIDSQLRQARQPVARTRTRSFGDPRAEYRRYYEALRSGNHSYAVTGFRNFVERFPGHDFADNAQYWLGEAFYDQKRYKSALVEFRKVAQNHPQGNKVPDALLKLGYCYSQLGEVSQAREVWEQIISVYPKSNPAALAKTKLSELED